MYDVRYSENCSRILVAPCEGGTQNEIVSFFQGKRVRKRDVIREKIKRLTSKPDGVIVDELDLKPEEKAEIDEKEKKDDDDEEKVDTRRG